MPINYKNYNPGFKTDTSPRIRFERAGGKCERCGAPHLEMIARAKGCYMLMDGETYNDQTGAYIGQFKGSEFPVKKFVRVILTTAHKDQDTRNDNEGNLAAWCQRCHLNFDRPENIRKRKFTFYKRRYEPNGRFHGQLLLFDQHPH